MCQVAFLLSAFAKTYTHITVSTNKKFKNVFSHYLLNQKEGLGASNKEDTDSKAIFNFAHAIFVN